MKQPEYTEGPEALENFERGMIALFKVPKLQLQRRKKGRKPASPRQSKKLPTRTRRGFVRFPRPCRFVARRFVFACQFGIGEAIASNLGHCQLEAFGIVVYLSLRLL